MNDRLTDRRAFLKTSTGAAAALATGVTILPSRARAANDRCVVGMIGAGGRGHFLAERLLERDDVDIAWVGDPDSGRSARTAKLVEDRTGAKPKTTQDFRDILDDGDVDAVINATPDHWHAIPTIMACQAGKDVYVEKPASHNIWEGRKMVEAARKYNRIVQLGTQNRSAPYVQQAVDYIRSGELGEVHYAATTSTRPGTGSGTTRAATSSTTASTRWTSPAG